MKRLKGWEVATAHNIENYSGLPFEWGTSDCFHMVGSNIELMTGENPLAQFYGYKTEAGAFRKLMKTGETNLGDVFAKFFPEIPPSLAQRGDIGVILRSNLYSAGVFTSFGFACKAEHGVIYEPVTSVERAFKIG